MYVTERIRTWGILRAQQCSKVANKSLDGCKPSPVGGTWGNVIRNAGGRKRTVDLEPAGHNGRVSAKGKLTGMGCAQEGTMVIIQAAPGMQCVGMLEHGLVCGEREKI